MPKVIKYLLVFTIVIAAMMYFAQPLIAWYLAPSGEPASINEHQPLDYSAMDFWAAHPNKKSSALVTPQGEVANATPLADVFFIHPTTYFGPGGWNSDVLRNGFDKQGVEHLLATAASTFNGCCAIYAPHYRQAHLNAFITEDREQGTDALDFAYLDVADAFSAFLAQRDPSRPYFIAGHSQGTLHGVRLLHQKIENTALAQNLVAAYLIGFWLPPDTYTKTIPSFPLCQAADDTACTVSYDTYDNSGPGRDNSFALPHWYPTGWEWHADKPGSCLNPLSWSTDQEYIGADANLGGIGWQGSFSLFNLLSNNNSGFLYTGLGQPVSAVTSARCGEFNMLWVDTQEGTAFDNPGKGADKSLHPKDWNLFYMNLRQNINERLRSFQSQPSV